MTGKVTGTDDAPRTAAEWVSLVISIALVAGVVAVILALWATSTGEPARFRIDRGPVRTEGANYYLPITVTNVGDRTGAQVMVEGKLGGGGDEEVSAITFDFLAPRSSANGVLVFGAEPTSAEVRVVSYEQP